MSDKDFRPADSDSAKQHFAHAALEEFARLGKKDDEAFLAKIGEKLDEIDFQTDVSGVTTVSTRRANRAKTLWISGAAAAVIVFGVFAVLHHVKEEERRTDSPQIIAQVATSGHEENAVISCGPATDLYGGLLAKQTKAKASPISSGPLNPHVLSPQGVGIGENGSHSGYDVDRDFDQWIVTDENSGIDRLFGVEDTRTSQEGLFYIDENDLITRVTEKPTGSMNFGAGVSRIDNMMGFLENPQSNFDLAQLQSQIPGPVVTDFPRVAGFYDLGPKDSNGELTKAEIRRELPLLPGEAFDPTILDRTLAGAERMETSSNHSPLPTVAQIDNEPAGLRSGKPGYGPSTIDSRRRVSNPAPTNVLSRLTNGTVVTPGNGSQVEVSLLVAGRPTDSNPIHKEKSVRAVVNGEEITQAELDRLVHTQFQLYLMNNKGQVPAEQAEKDIMKLQENALNDLIDRKLIMHEFKTLGGAIQPKYIDESVNRFVEKCFDGDKDKFLATLKAQSLSEEAFRDHQSEEMVIQVLRSRHNRGTSDSGLTDEKEWMNKLRKAAKIVIVEETLDPKPKPAPENEKYGQLIDNPFASPLKAPLSTFSVDVDTASYSNIRRMVTAGQMIPTDAVRIEEMINYFSYDYPQPEGQHPFALAVETAQCPWNADHQLLRVAIQGKDLKKDARPAANLVFLLDVSGSMNEPNKLPLVKKSMELLIEELNGNDTISIVVYAGSEGLCLPATSGSEKKKILDSLNCLQAGGSTNGGAGITLAYKMAKENYKADGINRVILCTDGDFNVGQVDNGSLVELVEKKAKDGTFLSVLGFGSGNINDSMLEDITNKGNGNYFYIDSIKEGRKVLLEEMISTLVTIAKDVKIQVEFNPKHVQDYRLIGYANRMLKAEDFANDKVDAGEIGAGHSVTALYEIVPAGAPPIAKEMSNLKYQAPIQPEPAKMKLVESDELCTLKFRYKLPKSDVSIPMEQAVTYQSREWQAASDDYQFAAAVGLWGMLLREAEHCGKGSSEMVLEMAKEGCGVDPFGRRNEFIELVKAWIRLKASGE